MGPSCIAGWMNGTPLDVPGITRTNRDIYMYDMGLGCIAGSVDGTSRDVPGYPRTLRDVLVMGSGYKAGSIE